MIDNHFEELPELECAPPIPLITISADKDGKDVFKTNMDAIEELKKVDTPIGIFSVCGAQGIGKSYLINCILDLIGEDKRDKGFGTTRAAVEKGFAGTP